MTGLRIAAVAVAAAFALTAAATAAHAAGATYRTEAEVCLQHVADAEEARQINPEIGDKAARTFEQLVAEARRLCETQDFAAATKVIDTAKGMVASE